MEQLNDDAAFESVRALVAAGEYLDDIPGIAAPSPSGGGAYLRTPEGGYRRIYRRGSPEYLTARAAGLVERLAALATAPAAAVEEAESIIGYHFPPLLRRLYLEVGNGGFGPGYGILGLSGGHRDDIHRGALDLYRSAHDRSSAHWSSLPASLLPICSWGCGIYSFVDCSQQQGQMWGWDPNPGPVDKRALFQQPYTLAEWLGRWVRRELSQPTLVLDEDTQQWRGATEQEHAEWMAMLDERVAINVWSQDTLF